MTALDELRQRVEGEYRRRTPRSRVLHERAQAWLPGGETRTGTAFAPYPTYMDRGEGNYLYDVDGNRLLDFTNNATSLIHGHAHPALVRAIQRAGRPWHRLARPARVAGAARPAAVRARAVAGASALLQLRDRGQHERDQGRARVHGP